MTSTAKSEATWRVVRLLGLIIVVAGVFGLSLLQVFSGEQLSILLYSLYSISVVSAIAAFVVGTVTYFGEMDDQLSYRQQGVERDYSPSTSNRDEKNNQIDRDEQTEVSFEPIPEVLDFHKEIDVIKEEMDESPHLSSFTSKYRELKTTTPPNRGSVVEDLRTIANALAAEIERSNVSSECKEAMSDIDEKISEYLGQSNLLVIEEAALYLNEKDEKETPVAQCQGEDVTINIKIRNRGDRTHSSALVRFMTESGSVEKEIRYTVGEIDTSGLESLSAKVNVPRKATNWDVSAEGVTKLN